MAAIKQEKANPLVSIIIPIYKVGQYLDRCIKSLAIQTYTNIEIILVDDGSPDNSGEICDNWASHDSRIIVIHKDNGGSASARNQGLRIAKGTYIGFADGDDWLDPHMIETMVHAAIRDNADVVVVGNYNNVVNNNGDVIKQTQNVPIPFIGTSNDQFRSYFPQLLEKFMFPPVWNKLYRTSLIRENNILFDESMPVGQDMSFNLPTLSKIERISVLDAALYYYNSRSDSTSSIKYKDSHFKSRVHSFELVLHYIGAWDPISLTWFANLFLGDIGHLSEGLYLNKNFSHGYRKNRLHNMIENPIVQKCAKDYSALDIRIKAIAQSIKWNSPILLALYAWSIVTAKRIRNSMRKLSTK